MLMSKSNDVLPRTFSFVSGRVCVLQEVEVVFPLETTPRHREPMATTPGTAITEHPVPKMELMLGTPAMMEGRLNASKSVRIACIYVGRSVHLGRWHACLKVLVVEHHAPALSRLSQH